MRALSNGRSGDLVYFVFDSRRLDLQPWPLLERKSALKRTAGRWTDPII